MVNVFLDNGEKNIRNVHLGPNSKHFFNPHFARFTTKNYGAHIGILAIANHLDPAFCFGSAWSPMHGLG